MAQTKDKRKKYLDMHRRNLTDKYINLLLHLKTGLPYSEFTDADREAHRERVIRRRAAMAANGTIRQHLLQGAMS